MRTGLTLLLLLAIPAGAFAQRDEERREKDSPGLLIEGLAGWDGTVDRSVPVPISFLIRNDSEQIINGELVLTDPLNKREVSLGEIVVSGKTGRRVASIRALEGWDECFAELRSGRQVLWRRELALTTGSEFDESHNFALFIDDGGRRLDLPAPADDTDYYRPELAVGGIAGRRVRCLSAKAWQVPTHPGPLSPLQAIVFPEQAAVETLNEVQWIAIARWMCQGGVVFVHNDSPAIVEQLLKSAPLNPGPPDAGGAFSVRSVGLGALYEYAQPLLRSEGNEMRALIGDTIAKLPRSPVEPILESSKWYYRSSARSELNRTIVLLFFLGYALLIGVVSLVLFRLSQRKMAIYAGVIVGLASILSGFLGGYLRFSPGDLNWTTVTLASAGGVVQYGQIDVRSAGGRNTRVAVTGNEVDLQFIPGSQNWYSWNQRRAGCPPFTYQTNLLTNDDDTWQAAVAMTPWGRRELRATAFQREFRALDFEVTLGPAVAASEENGNVLDQRQVTVKLVNHLPFDLRNCMLIIGGTRRAEGYQQALQQQFNNGWNNGGMWVQPGQTTVPNGDALIDVYGQRGLGDLAAGATTEVSHEVVFEFQQDNTYRSLELQRSRMVPPEISHLGESTAWIIGQMGTSPLMEIDEEQSDFDTEDEPVHVFVQRIRPEDLSDPEGFLRQSPAANSSAEPATE